MAYVIDRQRAIRSTEVVAVISVRQRRVRSRLVLRDNSLCRTLTHPQTFLRRVGGRGVFMTGRRAPRRRSAGRDLEQGADRI